jgi:hypothetical protein
MKKNQETAHTILLENLNGTRPLTEDGIRALVQEDPEIAVILILEQARRLRDILGSKQRKAASTPSGMIPTHEKPNTQKDRKKKQRGRKPGHKGACRRNPDTITQTVEQQIRFAVVMRKVCQGNQCEKGTWVQSVLMTIFRTLKRRGYNPVPIIVEALKTLITTGELPPFPPAVSSVG